MMRVWLEVYQTWSSRRCGVRFLVGCCVYGLLVEVMFFTGWFLVHEATFCIEFILFSIGFVFLFWYSFQGSF